MTRTEVGGGYEETAGVIIMPSFLLWVLHGGAYFENSSRWMIRICLLSCLYFLLQFLKFTLRNKCKREMERTGIDFILGLD
jgi:hypothetical protein